MKTNERLMEAYEKALRVPINKDSKMILFSDVHRGDNSLSDEFAHNQNIYYYALSKYFQEGYTYVEVGDGDELWEHSKFKHIRNAHSDVYHLLSKYHKQGRLLMLYGNHNMELKVPAVVKRTLYRYFDEFIDHEDVLFPEIEVHEALVFEHQESGKDILVVHGHQGDLVNDQLWWVTRFFHRYFWRYFHLVGFKNPASPAKNRVKRHKIERNFSKWIENHQKMIIAGHTHRPKFSNIGETPYFNTGCCIHPRSITGLEIYNGKIALIAWMVKPDDTGSLYITKKVVKGPDPIEKIVSKWD